MKATSSGQGVVVLAAYQPDPELFSIQLRSIRDQTRSDFRCFVGADGGQEDVRRLVDEFVGDDPRFEVIGWDDNLGFYLNFERLLAAVPEEAAWVALSDQDDRWHPEKLEKLVPYLDRYDLVTGQGTVVTWPERSVLVESTTRRVVPAEDLLFENQVTGAFSVFRRGLLAAALPFPRLHTVTQLHDHWLAMCAATANGYHVVDEPLQEYVQHGSNIVGEVATHRRRNPVETIRRIRDIADSYEGGHSLAQSLRACQRLSFGWRRLVVQTLAARSRTFSPGLRRPAQELLLESGVVAVFGLLWRALRSDHASDWVLAPFVPGLPYELYRRIATRLNAGARRPGRG